MTGFMTIDKFDAVIKAVSELAQKDVLVGIPDSAPERTDTPMTNAQIGYVQETGSPANNLQARPFLVPGVAAVQDKVAARFGKGADAALDGDIPGAERQMIAAGLVAENSVKTTIGSNIPPALSPSTIRNRNRSRQTQGMRQDEKDYLQAVSGGTDPAQAQSEAGIVALINTGSLRNAITHVLRKK